MTFYAIALIIAVFIYVGFAAFNRNVTELLLEITGAMFFGILAIVGWRFSPWWLVAGWFIHPVWDVLLHGQFQLVEVPAGYPVVCLGYDIAIGLVLVFECSRSDFVVSQR
jgi:hypothetical protein